MRTIAAIITGILVPPTHRAVIETLHPVAYLSMAYYEKWLYALERCAVTAGVLTQEEIEARVADTLATPDAPMPQDRNPEILPGVVGFVTEGVPHGPEHLAQPPRFGPATRCAPGASCSSHLADPTRACPGTRKNASESSKSSTGQCFWKRFWWHRARSGGSTSTPCGCAHATYGRMQANGTRS